MTWPLEEELKNITIIDILTPRRKMLSKLLVSLGLKSGPRMKSKNEICLHTRVEVCRGAAEGHSLVVLVRKGRCTEKKTKKWEHYSSFLLDSP